jgi:hypothetical protein
MGDEGKIGFNASQNCYGAPWYDWGLVYFEIKEDDGSLRPEYYPSKILGFLQVGEDIVEAVVQCSAQLLDWSTIKKDSLLSTSALVHRCTSFVKIPMSAIIHPLLCIIPDYCSTDENMFMVVLPKRNWSQYFSSAMIYI